MKLTKTLSEFFLPSLANCFNFIILQSTWSDWETKMEMEPHYTGLFYSAQKLNLISNRGKRLEFAYRLHASPRALQTKTVFERAKTKISETFWGFWGKGKHQIIRRTNKTDGFQDFLFPSLLPELRSTSFYWNSHYFFSNTSSIAFLQCSTFQPLYTTTTIPTN